jgi:phosphoribosyl-ATP pyrophosphohydrolase/phosphoribosyl-AMP cyclohydrolase
MGCPARDIISNFLALESAMSSASSPPFAAPPPDRAVADMLARVAFDAAGLVPAIAQQHDTGEVLMMAWMNREALAETLATGRVCYWSRSRGALWRKGETSGHTQHVTGVYADCDGDALLVQAHQEGVACHTGSRTCFFRALAGDGAAATMLGRIERIVGERKAAPRPGSYVAGLLAEGETAVCRKIGEEAVEVVTAALGGEGDRRVVEEVADLWFHTLVLLGARSIALGEVLEELARRHAARRAPGG